MKMIHTLIGARLQLTAQHYDTPKGTIVYPIKHSVEEGCMLVTLDPNNTEVATGAPLRVIPISKMDMLQR